MQGDDSGSAGTAWPGRGELDVMENVGYEPSTVHGSLHGPGYSGGAAVTKGYTLPGGVPPDWADKPGLYRADFRLRDAVLAALPEVSS
jgi:hypothetical protein